MNSQKSYLMVARLRPRLSMANSTVILSVKTKKTYCYKRRVKPFIEDQVKQIHSSELKNAFQKGIINTETLMFDNLVNNKTDFINDWLKPLNESWYNKFID